ncbi:bifunctional isocitrate dehydrogenase kinase/phosphatase [Neptunicella sp.]|uniref:bifunctional isocitrate dehydrogenase kinase/phosphatase n=1 Tax=Neptunicella sp. TaxID=2125986 RepID=UPI003F692775
MLNNDLVSSIAYVILKGFERHFRRYSRITGEAQHFFEQGQWQQSRAAVKQRISIYEGDLADVIGKIYQQMQPLQQPESFWRELKQQFLKLLSNHPQTELAETFYNSVIGRIFTHQKIDDTIMFVLPSRCYLAGQVRDKVVRVFNGNQSITEAMAEIFDSYHLNIQLANKSRDINHIEQYLRHHYSTEELHKMQSIEMLIPIFYRNQNAYLIGRICTENDSIPFVIALMLTPDKQLYVDALLTNRKDLSVLFGFARSYFLADSQYPAEMVAFLQELLPNKKHFELYSALGFYKHGKTVFYRNFIQHLDHSQDLLDVAPGIAGLVMTVFHLPSYGVVFKIIKDEFAESKKITREHVKICYKMVKMHDRVGRMADTHEFTNFRLPRQRLSTPLLAHLQEVATSNIELTDSEVIIKHVYIERKMTPLNIYLQQEQDEDKIAAVINDLGRCIKEIAAANIFPGDMLHKNFGVTRHGRVIFYDYDEICTMSQRNFRFLPQSEDPYVLDRLSVAPDDVFPEQFEHFIVGKKSLKILLKHYHPELMDPDYWRSLQQQIVQGEIANILPYPETSRFIVENR